MKLPLRARKTLAPRFTDFFTDFEKKLTVLQSKVRHMTSLVEMSVEKVNPTEGCLLLYCNN